MKHYWFVAAWNLIISWKLFHFHDEVFFHLLISTVFKLQIGEANTPLVFFLHNKKVVYHLFEENFLFFCKINVNYTVCNSYHDNVGNLMKLNVFSFRILFNFYRALTFIIKSWTDQFRLSGNFAKTLYWLSNVCDIWHDITSFCCHLEWWWNHPIAYVSAIALISLKINHIICRCIIWCHIYIYVRARYISS